jgi:ABC-2 type transport system permease protein
LAAIAGSAVTPRLSYEFDPTRPESRSARLLADQAVQQAYGRRDAAVVGEHAVTEPGGRYIDFLIPGLIGMNLMGSGMWGVGYAIVNARNRKLLKRFVATPMRRSHFLWSFVLSRLLYLVPEVAVLVAFAWLVFDVTVQGSIGGVALMSIAGAVTFSGLGLLVGARTESFEVASGWMNFVMLPMWLLSGSFFSYERFPSFTHPLIKVLPLTAVNDGLRALMSDGAEFWTVWPEFAVLVLWGVITFGLALRLFKWR